jgi:serine/threonine protein kinase
MNPRSLRNLLADQSNARGKKHSLSDCLQLAQSVATAVLYVHSCGFVHKNLRPENIIIFDEDLGNSSSTYPYAIGQPYLAGYDGVRQEDAPTLMLEVTSWQKRLYLPAERLKDKEHRAKFSWRHDVYGLGVVLLEIALWENFTSQSGPFYKALVDAEDPGSVLRQNWLKQVPRVMGTNTQRPLRPALTCFGQMIAGRRLKMRTELEWELLLFRKS